jgi:hypothetical protein
MYTKHNEKRLKMNTQLQRKTTQNQNKNHTYKHTTVNKDRLKHPIDNKIKSTKSTTK